MFGLAKACECMARLSLELFWASQSKYMQVALKMLANAVSQLIEFVAKNLISYVAKTLTKFNAWSAPYHLGMGAEQCMKLICNVPHMKALHPDLPQCIGGKVPDYVGSLAILLVIVFLKINNYTTIPAYRSDPVAPLQLAKGLASLAGLDY